ncbi:MAG: hypothetical protein WCF84_21390, partial [Anaerolineae bacterium]
MRDKLKRRIPLATLFAVTLFAMAVAVVFQSLYDSGGAFITLPTTSAPPATERPAPRPTDTPPATATPAFAYPRVTFGGQATEPGHLNNATHLTLDTEGRIYVTEAEGGLIQVFDSTGKYLVQWSLGGSVRIDGLAADRKGTVYVIADGQIVRYHGASGDKLGVVTYPGGDHFGAIAMLPDGGFVAVWYENRQGIINSVQGHREDLVRFDAAGNVLQTWSAPISSQTGAAEVETRLAVDPQSNILALGGTLAP